MEALRRLLNRARTFWAGLSPLRRFAVLAAGAFVVLALAAVSILGTGAEYRPLFTNLTPEEASAVTTRLRTANVPYRLEANGTTVSVPEDRLAQARVDLAAEGIPTRGGKGYEIFDESSLGMTPFVQNVNYLRALQGELARSIMQLEPVAYARVLIARAEPSPFVRDQQPTTASVVLKLKPNATLSRATVAGIVSLVARSVEGLKPENVTVVDSTGRLLSDPHAAERDEHLPAGQIEYRRELESYLAAKAEDMLARYLGPGRAVVRVSADINFQKVHEHRETYNPEARAVAAERTTSSRSTNATSRGVAGATSNISRTAGSSGGGAGGTSQEEVVQTDYLVSKSVRDLDDRSGGVQRLTVAAMADLTGEEGGRAPMTLADAQEIIKQAVGFRSGRDEIKVTDVRLPGTLPLTGLDEEAGKLQRVQAYVGLARNIALGAALLMTVALAALLLLRRRRPPAPAPEAPAADERQARLDRFTTLARDEPDRVAQVLGMLVGGREG